MTQSQALSILKTGRNVFITGPAGSGKTYVVNQYIAYLREHDVPVGITASTGIAATHMGGMTIHSWAGIGIKDALGEEALQELMERSGLRKRIEEAKVLIIDEVSMLHHFRLDLVEDVIRHIKKNDKPFGGMQIVLCGDFFQLPPVSRRGEPLPRFAYHARSWKEGNFAICYLSENYRQTDDASISILNEIRSGEVSDGAREQLRSRYVASAGGVPSSQLLNPAGSFSGDEESAIVEYEAWASSDAAEIIISEVEVPARATPSPLGATGFSLRFASLKSGELSPPAETAGTKIAGIEPTRLYTHNADVDGVNDAALGKVDSPECIYEMRSTGKKPLVEALKKSCLASEILRLRKGARVMCVKNNFEQGYVNGTLGVVVSCGPGVVPVIETRDGKRITIEEATWSIEENGRVLAEISQYPLRLAWAITVHKSQGMSLDAIEVDLSRSFEPGMGYVALSRVRTLDGLTILGINEAALQVHPEVLEHDRLLKDLSEQEEDILNDLGEAGVKRAQDEFLAIAAPLHKMLKEKRAKGIKAPKITTIDKTAMLVKAGKSLPEIAKEREMVAETIVAHLEKLIALGPDNGGLAQSDIAYFKKEISPAHFSKIEKALEDVSISQGEDELPFLSPVKSKAGANVSFKEIRLARVLLGYVKKGMELK